MDKGRGTVIVNTAQYITKLNDILSDTTRFSKLVWNNEATQHPILRFEEKVQRTVRTILKEKVEHRVYNNIYPSGTALGKMYGAAKVHKDGVPLRPIVSMVNTPTYQLAKYLNELIKPYCPRNYTVESSFDFIHKLKQSIFEGRHGTHCVSFDIVNLFTHVPRSETIDIVCDYVFKVHNDDTFPFTKANLKKVLLLATEGMFSFNNTLYKQIDGVAMGSPLAPTLADFFIGHLESELFSNTQDYFPLEYYRYVDDTFCVFPCKVHSDLFLQHLNSLHPNVKFTCAHAEEGHLPFLDVDVMVNDNDIQFAVYRKPTFTGRLLNYNFLVPKVWKLNTVTSMVYRAYHLTSNWQLFHDEIIKIKNILMFNDYPKWWLNRAVRNFLNNIFDKRDDSNNISNTFTNFYIIKIPFWGTPSIKLKKDINCILRKLNNKKVKVCFYMKRLSSYFSLKDKDCVSLLSNIVYKYTCPVDQGITYVGETKRQLIRRAQQHNTNINSGIYRHLQNCQACTTQFYSNFTLVSKACNAHDLEIKESLVIKNLKPCLNTQQITGKQTTALHLF